MNQLDSRKVHQKIMTHESLSSIQHKPTRSICDFTRPPQSAIYNTAKTPPKTPTIPATPNPVALAPAPLLVLLGVPIIFAAAESIALTSAATAVCTAWGTFFVYHV